MPRASARLPMVRRTCSSAITLRCSTGARRSASSGNLVVLSRHFTYEPIAIAMARGDDDLRLLVDTVLSDTYRSAGFRDLVQAWFGPPDETVVTFFRQTTLPQ